MLGAGSLALAGAAAAGVRFMSGGGGSGVEDVPTLFDADFVRGRYSVAGAPVDGEAAFLAALSGSGSNGRYQLGPYVAPDAPELLVNGDFSQGLTGWAVRSGGTETIDVVDGELVLTCTDQNAPGFVQPISPEPGRAYRLRGKRRRGSAGALSNINIGVMQSANANQTELFAQSSNYNGTAFSEAVLYCGGFSVTPHVGGRVIVGPANGTAHFDDFSMRETLPHAGFIAGEVAGIVDAVAPSSPNEAVLWQADDNAEFNGGPLERNYLRLIRTADGHLRFFVMHAGAQQASLDLGPVAAGKKFTVAFSAEAKAFRAAFIGGPIIIANAGTFPGISAIRTGGRRSQTEGLWQAQIERVRHYARAFSAAEFTQIVADGKSIVAWGDSLTAGAGASDAGESSYPAVASALFGQLRGIVNLGIGGQNSTQIAARMNAIPTLVTVAAGTIPGSGGVSITDKSINMLVNSGTFAGSQTGKLAGVQGTMTTDAAGNWTFVREASGEPVPCPSQSLFVTDFGEAVRRRTNWLWLGRNGAQAGYTVEDDIAAAVSRLGHQRYLVGAILTSAADDAAAVLAIQARNAGLAAVYGDRFVDLYIALRSAGDGSSEDTDDIRNGHIPRSLRSDHVHLNDAGYAIVAGAMHQQTVAMGW